MNRKNDTYAVESAMLPYEKFSAFGAERLSDAELLAIIIRKGTKDRDALSIAKDILGLYGSKDGLLNLMRFSDADFADISGIGRVKAIQLAAIAELSKRIWRENCRAGLRLSEPSSIAAFYKEELRYCNQEKVCLLLLDGQKRYLRSMMVSQGTINASAVSPREIFYEALRHRAAFFVIVHNHPSGRPDPSKADIDLAMALRLIGSLMNIPMLDCLIIADNTYLSFCEEGILES